MILEFVVRKHYNMITENISYRMFNTKSTCSVLNEIRSKGERISDNSKHTHKHRERHIHTVVA